MEAQFVYMPEDRRYAAASGRQLPVTSCGTALFGDISGFTPLADILVKELGNQKGAEELTGQLNAVFDAIISPLHHFQGSVIGFSGDAITCWLDGDNGLRAIACALEMQRRMGEFKCINLPSGQTISLAMKVAVAIGPIHRFLVGDPQIQLIDVLAGRTLTHLSEAEHMAGRGEVILHPDGIQSIKNQLEIAEWREQSDSDERFAIISGLREPVEPNPWPVFSPDKLSDEQIRPWLLSPVYKRLSIGMGRFLAELRPAVAVFVQFLGIEFEADPSASEKLNSFIRAVIHILDKYDGSLIQLTIGDKGSYLYAAFGAPIAHEDDAIRAVSTAQDIRALQKELDFLLEMRIGISKGRMRTGDYGSKLRRTYGVLGDEVNVAARLMQAADPGQILGTQAIWKSTSEVFHWKGPQKIKIKGKQAALHVFMLETGTYTAVLHTHEPEYILPMVGRENELQEIEQVLSEVHGRHGQVMAITGEAGMGKSRIVAEMMRSSVEKHFTIHNGACQSFGTRVNYLVWQNIFQGLFGLHSSWTIDRRIATLRLKLEQASPILVERIPLLNSVLGLTIPDNELTQSMDAKLRKASLEALLVEYLKFEAREHPLLLVLEDCHWIDDLSRDLLLEVRKIISGLPILLVLVYRPLGMKQLEQTLVKELGSIREIRLSELSQNSIEQLISLKIRNLFGSETNAAPELVEAITIHSEGNPFYVEEILNYLRDRGIDPQNPIALEEIALPDTLQSLILSRIDQLTEKQQITLKVASVIGREFRAAWLCGYYEDLGYLQQISDDLYRMSQIELLSLQTTSPELIYLFKHILIQEAAYESLPFTTRATLHDQLGQYIEDKYQNNLGPYLNLLAYHYEHSENVAKKREYLVKAGDASQVNYANEAAINYYERVLPMLSGNQQVVISRKLGQVMELVGRWVEAEKIYQQAIEQSGQLNDLRAQADCMTAMGELERKRGHYSEASFWLDHTQSIYQELTDDVGLGQVLHYKGTVAAHQGEYEQAQNLYTQSLTIRKRLNDWTQIASLLSNMGIVARFQGQYQHARELHEQALKIRRELGDKWAIGVSLNNLGNVAIDQGNFEEARLLQEEGLAIRRAVGDRWAIANALNNLGNLAREQGEYSTAISLYRESMEINHELKAPWAISYLLEDMGSLFSLTGQSELSMQFIGAASKQREMIGAPLSPAEKEKLERAIDRVRSAIGEDRQKSNFEQGRNLPIDQVINSALEENNLCE